MYLIFNYQSGVLQFGFRTLQSINIQHGLILSNQLKANLTDNFYYKNNDLFIINNPYLFIDKINYILKDYRINLKIESIKFIFRMCLILFFFLRSYKKYNIKIIFRVILLLCIFIKFFPLSGFPNNKEEMSPNSIKWNQEDWIDFFHKSKTANYIAQNKFDYISSDIPYIKGITDFRVLPLNNQSNVTSHFQAKIAASYRSLISINTDKSITILKPKYYCDIRPIYFYEINENNDVLIFEKSNLVGLNYEYYIFRDENQKKIICEDEIHSKHQIEE